MRESMSLPVLDDNIVWEDVDGEMLMVIHQTGESECGSHYGLFGQQFESLGFGHGANAWQGDGWCIYYEWAFNGCRATSVQSLSKSKILYTL